MMECDMMSTFRCNRYLIQLSHWHELQAAPDAQQPQRFREQDAITSSGSSALPGSFHAQSSQASLIGKRQRRWKCH